MSEYDLLLEELLYVIVVVFHLIDNQSLLRFYFKIDLLCSLLLLCFGSLCA